VRSRTAGVMTTLMRNGRDRRLGKPVKGHAILERALLVGTRSADHIRASGHCGCIAMEVSPPFENRPYTWLHPNASQIRQIPPCTAGAVHTWPFAIDIASHHFGSDQSNSGHAERADQITRLTQFCRHGIGLDL
jgi:hypothetical protein